jgi:hypothetical protein
MEFIHDGIVTDRRSGNYNIHPNEITRIKNICNEKIVQESAELHSLREELLGLLPAEATERPTAAASLALSATILQPAESMAPQPATQAPAAQSFISMGKGFLERCKRAAVRTAATVVQKAQDAADTARAYVLPAGFLPTNRMNFGKTLPVATHPAAAASQVQAQPTRRELINADQRRSAAMRKEARKGAK